MFNMLRGTEKKNVKKTPVKILEVKTLRRSILAAVGSEAKWDKDDAQTPGSTRTGSWAGPGASSTGTLVPKCSPSSRD